MVSQVEGDVINSQDRSVVNSMELVCKFDLVMNHCGEKNRTRNFPKSITNTG
jgi:hypothetical protein